LHDIYPSQKIHEVEIDPKFQKQNFHKLWYFECFLNVFNSHILLQKIESKKNGIMKIEGHFMKVMLFNEPIKGPLLKPKHEIKTFYDLI
jgi:hypothetical protein